MTAKDSKFEIHVYDKKGNIVKTCQAADADLKFGPVRKLMALLNIDNIEDTGTLLSTVYGAWDQITETLDLFFPDMEDDDWDNVSVEELLRVLIGITKASFAKILGIPAESKN